MNHFTSRLVLQLCQDPRRLFRLPGAKVAAPVGKRPGRPIADPDQPSVPRQQRQDETRLVPVRDRIDGLRDSANVHHGLQHPEIIALVVLDQGADFHEGILRIPLFHVLIHNHISNVAALSPRHLPPGLVVVPVADRLATHGDAGTVGIGQQDLAEDRIARDVGQGVHRPLQVHRQGAVHDDSEQLPGITPVPFLPAQIPSRQFRSGVGQSVKLGERLLEGLLNQGAARVGLPNRHPGTQQPIDLVLHRANLTLGSPLDGFPQVLFRDSLDVVTHRHDQDRRNAGRQKELRRKPHNGGSRGPLGGGEATPLGSSYHPNLPAASKVPAPPGQPPKTWGPGRAQTPVSTPVESPNRSTGAPTSSSMRM